MKQQHSFPTAWRQTQLPDFGALIYDIGGTAFSAFGRNIGHLSVQDDFIADIFGRLILDAFEIGMHDTDMKQT